MVTKIAAHFMTFMNWGLSGMQYIRVRTLCQSKNTSQIITNIKLNNHNHKNEYLILIRRTVLKNATFSAGVT
jgi:hypothetical protein